MAGTTHSKDNLSSKELSKLEYAKYCSSGYRGVLLVSSPIHTYRNWSTKKHDSDTTPAVGFGYGVLGASGLAHPEGIHLETHFDKSEDEEGT